MKLTSLEIQGFKSFAERTRFSFHAGITGIVGPNGCGKSNVIDSIRWVLGEQRTRALRSEKMENIIFNGTDKRKKANFAEVCITFENTRNLLPTEYTTVAITRRLYRDGDSEYLINNVSCRLKDIQNLFLDTGIGSDSYAIIELGMVDDILQDKQNSRRQLFEEAAGISRYKIRKKETLQRLDETDKSLERVDDLLFEIEKNLKSLEKQAKRAEQFFELKQEYRLQSSRMAFLKIQNLRNILKEIETQDAELIEKITAVDLRIAKHEARITELQRTQLDQEDYLGIEHKNFNLLSDNIKRLEKEKDVRNERMKYLQQREQEIHNRIQNGKTQVGTLQAQMTGLEEKIDEANEEYDTLEYSLAELETEQEELKTAVHNRKIQSEEVARDLRNKENQLTNLLRDKEVRQAQVGSLQKELARSEEDRANRSGEMTAFTEKIEVLTTELVTLQTDYNNVANQKQTIETQTEETEAEIKRLNEALFVTKRTLDAKRHEHDLIKEMVESLEGFPESVKFLKQNFPKTKNAPLISDIFSCEQDYKVAVENFLEPYMNYYVVPNRVDAFEGVKMLRNSTHGRAQFFILNEVDTLLAPPEMPLPAELTGQVIPFLALVEFPPAYTALARYLFSNAYIYKGETDITVSLPEGISLMHAGGGVIVRKFSLGGGSVGLFEGKRIGRAKNLEKLAAEIKTFTAKQDEEEKRLISLKNYVDELKKSNPATELNRLGALLVQKQQEVSIIQSKTDEYKNTLSRIGQRSDTLEKDIERLQNELGRIEPQLEALQDNVNELHRESTNHQKELNSRQEMFADVTKKFNEQNLQFVNVKNHIAGLKKDFRNYLEQINLTGTSEEQLKAELVTVNAGIQELITSNTNNDDEIVVLYTRKKNFEERLATLETELQATRTGVQQNDMFIRQERKLKEEVNGQRDNIRERGMEQRISMNALGERMQVEWDIDIQTIDQATIFNDKVNYVLDDIEANVLKLREKYNKFGEVNTTAIEAYKEIKERHDFISEQKADLVTAKNDLLNTIGEIDGTAKEKFLETFTLIREHFINVFRTLFTEHDTCDLILANPDDALESPIDIIAKPKGKRPLSIGQLSGGEKTLTAISLLFAIYLIKPAPFCIFDEVDAPLDDQNIDKFNNIIQEFSKDSQFIIVTHNKRTMVKTNVIYGVTMEETGISRVLPVDLTTLNLN